MAHRARGMCLRIALALAAGAALPAQALPTFEAVRQDFSSSESLLLDRRGEVVHRLRTDSSVRRGQWIALADISPALQSAMLLSEDKRFYQHSGVDWKAAGAAAWGNLWHTRTRGASTISMQLAGLLDEDLRRGRKRRTLLQKFGQAGAAALLDGQWRKDQILEAYLNLVPWRGEIIGIDALSHTLFDKDAHALDAREAAMAAALVRAPNATPQKVAQRACDVLAQMQAQARSQMLCDSLGLFAAGVMQRRAWSPSDGHAPHLAQRLLRAQPAGSRVRSTLSAPLQAFAVEQLQRHLHELSGRNVSDGAVLVLDNATGDVLAWVGASASTSAAPEVDGVLAQRQPGSTLKPFLYAQAIAQRRLTAASLLDDSPAAISTPGGLYVPQNYDLHFKGWVSVRLALGSSLNVPAVRALVLVGVNPFARQLRRLGIELAHTGDWYGYSLALGSPEMSLLALTNAYRALANGGRYSPVRTTPSPAAPVFTPAIDARAAYIVGHILSDNNARVPTFGHNSQLHTRFWSAVKTGTSKDMRDNWAVGYSSRYTVGVWVGNASGQPMWDVSGTSGATPVWASVMRYLHTSAPSRRPHPPAGLVAQDVRFSTGAASQHAGADALGNEASRSEWFLAGTQQALFAVSGNARNMRPRIEQPVDGSIYAIDPDIPAQKQRIWLRASTPNAQWWLDDVACLGQGNPWPWMPWPGRHSLSLRSPQGQKLDTVQIEVRGAALRPGATLPPEATGTSGACARTAKK